MKTEIFGMPLPQLQTALAELGMKKFRAKQIYDWLYQKCVFDFAQMSNLGKAERFRGRADTEDFTGTARRQCD